MIFSLLFTIFLACSVLGLPSNETVPETDFANETTASLVEEARQTRTIQLSFNTENLTNTSDKQLSSPRFSHLEGDWWLDVKRWIYNSGPPSLILHDEIYTILHCSLKRKSMTFTAKWTSTLLGQKQNFTQNIEVSCGAAGAEQNEILMMDWEMFSNPRNGYVDLYGNATTVTELTLIL